MIQNKKEFIWIFIPFIYGYLSSIFLIALSPLLNQIIFGLLWFWVGMKYANLYANRVKGFLIGNSIWLVSFLLYIWQFVILNDENRNLFLAGLSQHYVLSYLWSGREVYLLFIDTRTFYTTPIIIISFLIMLLVFSLGFLYGVIRGRFEEKQLD